MDTSEKRQWTLIDTWISSGQNGYLTQFLKDHNFPHKDNIPVVGKYKTKFRTKLDGLKTLTAREKYYVIKEGIESGRNLLLIKFHPVLEHLLATDPTTAPTAPTAPTVIDLRIDRNRRTSITLRFWYQ